MQDLEPRRGMTCLIFSKLLLPCSLGPDLPKLLHSLPTRSPSPPWDPVDPSLHYFNNVHWMPISELCLEGREGERCAPALVKASSLWKR